MSARVTAALVALTVLLATPLVAAPASAQPALFTIPVDCATDKVVLTWDHRSYDLDGTCGVVVVRADDVEVDMPTAQKLVVRGHGNTIVSKPVDTVRLHGRNQDLSLPSARRLRVASPGSVVRVDGLLEHARLVRGRALVTADQVSSLVVEGNRNRVRARRGYDARVEGNRNTIRFRRLGRAAVTGDHNTLRVRRGATRVRDRGTGNHVRVHRRG